MDADEEYKKLMKAVHAGQPDAVTELLNQGIPVDPEALDATTALVYTCGVMGNAAITRLLLEAGADPNRRDDEGNTPLFWAIDDGYIETAQELISHGAEVNLKNNFGHTSLMSAASRGPLELVEFLLNNGADVSLADEDGWTAEDWAIEEGDGDVEIVNRLQQARYAAEK